MRRNKYIVALVLIVLAFIYYAWKSMIYSFSLEVGSFSLTSLVELLVICIGCVSLFSDGNNYSTKFTVYWTAWIIWLFVIFLVFRLGGNGISNIIHVMFCPVVFLAFFKCSSKISDIPRPILLVLVALFLVVSYKHITLSFELTALTMINDGYASSNFVYWPMCCMPFLFLIDNKYIKYSLLLILVVCIAISQKRAPMFAVVISLLPFVLSETKNIKISYVLIAAAGIFCAIYFLGDYFNYLFYRVGQISEDEGSGRIPIWNDVINYIKDLDIASWVVGRGYGSIKETRHTNAHNDMLQMIYEYGIVGAIFYIRLLVLTLKRTLTLKKTKSTYFMGYFSCFCIMLVMGGVSNMVVFNSFFAFLCAYMGYVEGQCFTARPCDVL